MTYFSADSVPIGVAVLEDDPTLRSAVTRGLTEEGYKVWPTATGAELLSLLDRAQPDVLIVDIGLPDSDGRDVAMAARSRGSTASVLFLSARGSLTDRLSGFGAGGQDYVTKPFDFDELVARVRVLARRAASEPVVADRMVLDPTQMSLEGDEGRVSLTPTEFRILSCLGSNRGRLVRRNDLVRAAWPPGARVSDNTLDSFIARVRRKLRLAGSPAQVVTTHGVGYRLA